MDHPRRAVDAIRDIAADADLSGDQMTQTMADQPGRHRRAPTPSEMPGHDDGCPDDRFGQGRGEFRGGHVGMNNVHRALAPQESNDLEQAGRRTVAHIRALQRAGHSDHVATDDRDGLTRTGLSVRQRGDVALHPGEGVRADSMNDPQDRTLRSDRSEVTDRRDPQDDSSGPRRVVQNLAAVCPFGQKVLPPTERNQARELLFSMKTTINTGTTMPSR